MLTLDDYTDSLAVLVPGPHPMTDADLEAIREKSVEKAMIRHSRHFPRRISEEITGNGSTDDYPLADLAHWNDDFSGILSIEYPADEYPAPSILDPDSWMSLKKPGGEYLRLMEDTVPADTFFRVLYTAPHVCTVSNCTVSDIYAEALTALAGHFYCRMLAAKYVHNSNTTIAADSVDHASQFRDFVELGDKLLAEYRMTFGIQGNKALPACIIVDQDVMDSRGYDRLTHPGRLR